MKKMVNMCVFWWRRTKRGESKKEVNDKNFTLIEGDVTIQDHYGYLTSYAKALFESNKVGVTVNPDEKPNFDRFHVCFKGLKEGWKIGCRKIIALDGCFLKKPNTDEILTVIGRDDNNHIFLVAWAAVNVKSKDNWSWVIELLADDLELPNAIGLTLMSDQHKGLIEAVKDVMPFVEHQQCARHIYERFRKQFSGVEFRGIFWAASKASYPQLFNKIMDKIKRANPRAHQYLLAKDPKTWSRAFFTECRCCEAVENGLNGCFNSLLDQQRFWHVIPCGGNQFEVRRGSDAFKMVEDYVPECFKKDRILGPKPKKMPSRPRKKRVRASYEPKKKKKDDRPKKIPNTKILEKNNVVPAFVNNDINEFEMGSSNSRVVFNDGRVINVGKFNFNKKKMSSSSSIGHVKMRGGKTKGGRLIPAQRLGRLGTWLGMNSATSDTIEDAEPFHASLPALKHVNTNGSNILGTI
ncbi:pentatricopeptide repeat-containing protein [Tanacetum coccineum]